VESKGGRTLPSAHIIPVFFSGDPLETQLEEFLRELAQSSYWSGVTKEYVYKPTFMTVGSSIVVSDPAPSTMDESAITAWLSTNVDTKNANPFNPYIVYIVFFPSSTTVTTAAGTGCIDFDGFHAEGPPLGTTNRNEAASDEPADASVDFGTDVGFGEPADDEGSVDAIAGSESGNEDGHGPPPAFLYAVFLRCQDRQKELIDALTANVSHDLAEIATDPLPQSWAAYVQPDVDHAAWALSGFGEIGDMCVYAESPERVDQRLVGKFLVQRMWSNAAAEANRDPCVPSIAEPYFVAIPDLRDQVWLGASSGGTFTTGLQVSLGEFKTVDVHLSSTGPMADWIVYAAEVPGPMPDSGVTSSAPTLAFWWDKQTGHNGDVLKLTINRLADGPMGGTTVGIYSFPNWAEADAGTNWNAWYAFVAN
jgi:hypothetical protein